MDAKLNGNQEKEQAIKQLAGEHFKEGYNCAESILRAFNTVLDLKLSDDALRMGVGFGGGLGHAGCVCGALAASVMVLGAVEGRMSRSQSLEPMYRLSQGFHSRFEDTFGGTCCRVLNPHPFNTKDHLRTCLKLTSNTAALLMNYMQENNLGKKL